MKKLFFIGLAVFVVSCNEGNNNTPENINDNRQNTIDTRDIGDEGDYTGDNISPQLENDTAANDSSGLLIVDPISNAEDARNQAEEGDLELE